MSIAKLLTHTTVVYRLTNTADDFGGVTSVYAEHIASYECRIYQPTGKTTIEDIGKIDGTIFKGIGAEADILTGDKIVDGFNEYIVKKVYPVYDKSSIDHYEFMLDKIE